MTTNRNPDDVGRTPEAVYLVPIQEYQALTSRLMRLERELSAFIDEMVVSPQDGKPTRCLMCEHALPHDRRCIVLRLSRLLPKEDA